MYGTGELDFRGRELAFNTLYKSEEVKLRGTGWSSIPEEYGAFACHTNMSMKQPLRDSSS